MEVDDFKDCIENIRHGELNSGKECRLCLKLCNSQYSLFGDGTNMVQKLMAFANVQVSEGDGLPTVVCLNCRHLVDVSYNFKYQVEQSDHKLRQALMSKNSKLRLKHSINKVIAEALSEGCTQTTSYNNDNCIEPHSDFRCKKIDRFDIQPAEQPVLASLNNEENVIAFGSITSCDEKNRNPSKIVKEIDIYLEKQPGISGPDNNEQSSMGNQDITKTVNCRNPSFEEEYVKLERTQTSLQSDTTFSKIDGISTRPKSVDSFSRNSNETDEEETPLICRTHRKKCLQCIKTFSTRMALEEHMILHKQKTNLRYVCYLCDRQFDTVDQLKSHVRISHKNQNEKDKALEERRSKDTENSKRAGRTGREGNLEENCKRQKKPYKFSCKICSKQFTYQKSFISHAKIHTECDLEDIISEYLPSKASNSLFDSTDNQNQTENESDDGDKEIISEGLQCKKCGKLFATNRNLKRHLLTHTGLKYNCSMCGKEFSRIDKLREHEQSKHKVELFGQPLDDENEEVIVNENKMNGGARNRKKEKYNRPHQCNICPKAFAQLQSLANHMERHKRIKDTQKRFLCEVCSKCFAQSGSLVAHMRTHTGIKPYVCNICTKAFTKSTYLQLHLRTHSGEKPYICQYCSRAFARANTLARHITMHTGEAKYHCQICMKSFRRLTSLNEHTYTHTGQRPYACKICAKRYNNAGSLYAHTKKCKSQQHSGEVPIYIETGNDTIQNTTVPQMVIYPQKKLVNQAAIGQVTPTPQFVIANVYNQKPLTTNIIQPFTVEDPDIHAMNAKQFKNSYYAIYPNM